MECGAKRSAAPLWLNLESCEVAENHRRMEPGDGRDVTSIEHDPGPIQSDVALRLPPHSMLGPMPWLFLTRSLKRRTSSPPPEGRRSCVLLATPNVCAHQRRIWRRSFYRPGTPEDFCWGNPLRVWMECLRMGKESHIAAGRTDGECLILVWGDFPTRFPGLTRRVRGASRSA